MSLERLELEALGSRCELFGIGVPRERLNAGAAWLREMHRRLTRFDPESELSRFNASAGRWVDVSPTLEAALREALRAYEVSGGLVHAGVLPGMLAIGYTRTFAAGPTAPGPLTRPLAPLPQILEILPGRARLRRGCGIDLGGIAKGWLADALAVRLGANVLVNLGGDLFARGGGSDGNGWPVGFGETTVLLKDAGSATSGTWRRRWGDGLHHILDPRSGSPAQSDLVEVSVIARTAAEAEILAKTALILGSARAEGFLEGAALGWRLN